MVSPVPIGEDLIDLAAPAEQRAKARRPWTQWLVDLLAAVNLAGEDVTDLQADMTTAEAAITALQAQTAVAVSRVASTSLTAQTSSLGPTTIYTPAAAGTYRVSVSANVTTFASTSSSLEATITWTDSGVASTTTSAAQTDNTVGHPCLFAVTVQSGATPIAYTITYGSVGGTAMAYKLTVTVEKIP